MTEVKLDIPYTLSDDRGSIVGVLRRQDGSPLPTAFRNSSPRPITLILHGVLAHKDQLFHRSLAQKLPLDSFRFDFRHADKGGESRSTKVWDMSTFGEDVIDMHIVIKHLRLSYNYHVESIVAHSRGVLDTWSYYWDVEMRRAHVIPNEGDKFLLDRIPFYVALSGRWDMAVMRKRFEAHDFAGKGPYVWSVRVAGKDVSVNVTRDMVDGFCAYPIQEMADKFPASVDCLIMHGSKDITVPVQDAFAYKGKLEKHMTPPRLRSSSHELSIIDGADHSFRGQFDTIVQQTCSWLDERRALVRANDPDASPAAIEFAQRCPLAAIGGHSPSLGRL